MIVKDFCTRGALVISTLLAMLLGAALHCSTRECASLAEHNATLTAERQHLASEVTHYRTLAGESAASVEALRLHTAELERLRSADAATINELRLRLRRVESLTTTALEGTYSASVPILHDTTSLLVGESHDTTSLLAEGMHHPSPVRHFEWSDGWATVRGRIEEDSVHCEIKTVDTLRQIVHRVPRKFLFFRFGTRALRQEIISSNPHNRIVYAEYIEVEK